MIALLQHLNPAGAQNGLAMALRAGCFGAARKEWAAAAASAMPRHSSSQWQPQQLSHPAAFNLQHQNFLHISAPCAALQHHEIKPEGGLYLDGLLFMKQPWKAVLVDAAGKACRLSLATRRISTVIVLHQTCVASMLVRLLGSQLLSSKHGQQA